MNLLFWNLYRNKLEDYIAECISEKNIDIAVFAEYSCVDFKLVEKKLCGNYKHITKKKEKVTLIARIDIDVNLLQSQQRYNLYQVDTGIDEYILAAIHLEDRRNYQPAERNMTIRDIVEDIKTTEKSFDCNNSIVIGDFNANPYDYELTGIDTFNAVLFKPIIKKNELTKPKSKKIKRFYNPILNCISEKKHTYGSYYDDREANTSYWYCLDQVLVRKPLVDKIKHIEYLKTIDSRELIMEDRPNKKISDHLPLFISIKGV